MPCVAIEVGEDGTVKVGMIPPEATAQYAKEMQPAQSVEDALGTAKDLLSGQTGEQAQAASAEGGFAQGFAKQQPIGAPAPARPGGMG